jgi:hypothetical protein
LSKFSSAFERYFDDRFTQRIRLTALRNFIAYKFGTSGNPEVIVGRQGWLFYDRHSSGASDASRNTSLFSESALKLWARMLQNRQNALLKHGIKYCVVFAPEKGSLYPEFLPDGRQRLPGASRIEQLHEYLRHHTSVHFVDAKSILLGEKTKGRLLYLKTDSHWNDLGASRVALEMLRQIGDNFPELKLSQRPAISFHDQKLKGDLADLLAVGDLLTEQAPTVCVTRAKATSAGDACQSIFEAAENSSCRTRIPGTNLPRAYILRDSFCSRLAPVLSESFSEAIYEWTHDFDEPKITAASPDLVIEEIAERHLFDGYPDSLAVLLDAASGDSAAVVGDFQDEHCQIAEYDDGVVLRIAPAKRTISGISLRFLWHTTKPLKLDYKYAFISLDRSARIIGGHDNVRQDFDARNVAAGASWIDEFEMPLIDWNWADRIGFVRYKEPQGEVGIRKGNADGGNGRLLIPIGGDQR